MIISQVAHLTYWRLGLADRGIFQVGSKEYQRQKKLIAAGNLLVRCGLFNLAVFRVTFSGWTLKDQLFTWPATGATLIAVVILSFWTWYLPYGYVKVLPSCRIFRPLQRCYYRLMVSFTNLHYRSKYSAYRFVPIAISALWLVPSPWALARLISGTVSYASGLYLVNCGLLLAGWIAWKGSEHFGFFVRWELPKLRLRQRQQPAPVYLDYE